MFVIFLRSLIFNVLFYLLLVGWLIVAIPTFLLPRRALIKVAKMWGQSSIWLMRLVCGTRVEFRGLEKIPPGPLIVAPKHQSMWETFALLQFFDAPLYILKRELTWIPVFGWLLVKADMIAINRRKGGRILMEMAKSASREVNRGRQLIIFPEGTRTPVDAPPHYKAGVAQIYADCDVPCLPVALNSGLFWPRRQFMRYPGTIVVEFLDPLPAGLERREFLTRVSAAIETASNRLIAEARKEQAELFGRVPSVTSHQAKQAPKPERGQAG
ncbi:lysophospholipid acyltransferase family protein [Rhodopseudomonas sp. BR0M22]|uniref:lysophospholipid acyltransferase family protein n=1 Tax=Rhodopseudomonas sp. BR0M22 TaxID=2269369 RepID=UPI0013DEC189|nr:lysophospholipid acyltransferase family protein [Rhodopseudomonas sp. BR0M22]NEW93167.1 1-acyl-sn-glycerol-3-phosphate acyltransferase [Rhodopseudomonas sp. BR0M22]